MKLNLYLIRDSEYTTVKTTLSELKAMDCLKYNPKLELEKIEIDIPKAATNQFPSINNKVPKVEKILTLKEVTDNYIKKVVYSNCSGDITKAAKLLEMSKSVLKLYLKDLELK